MSDALHVFWDGEEIGTFTRDSEGISFRYTSTATRPISLSLPLTGEWSRKAPETFLDNFLPDNSFVRKEWAEKLHTTVEPFDLLTFMGHDVAGALILQEENVLRNRSATIYQATYEDIARRVSSLAHVEAAWLSADEIGTVRMSLAGFQGKFTLSKRGENAWLWPSWSVPSTHIFKPEPLTHLHLATLEAKTLQLAQASGIDAAHAHVENIAGIDTFVVERFDRRKVGNRVQRIHAEDVLQALAIPSKRKYEVSGPQVIELFKRQLGEADTYRFIEQLAFNIAIGNTDGHGKNFTIIHGEQPMLAPLYDSIPIRLWPQYDPDMAMHIGGAKTCAQVEIAHWKKLAAKTGLDEEKVVHLVQQISTRAFDLAETVFTADTLPHQVRDRLLQLIGRNTVKTRLGGGNSEQVKRIVAVGITSGQSRGNKAQKRQSWQGIPHHRHDQQQDGLSL